MRSLWILKVQSLSLCEVEVRIHKAALWSWCLLLLFRDPSNDRRRLRDMCTRRMIRVEYRFVVAVATSSEYQRRMQSWKRDWVKCPMVARRPRAESGLWTSKVHQAAGANEESRVIELDETFETCFEHRRSITCLQNLQNVALLSHKYSTYAPQTSFFMLHVITK
jgi:hypothetical protein